MYFNITTYSTALFSTWYFIEDMNLLFDAGDGLTAALLQKSRKIDHVFVSHADRDHLTGLLQLNQLNARENLPVIYYPKDCGSFPRLEEFSKKFDPHIAGTIWQGILADEHFLVKDDLYVQSFRNNHVPAKYTSTKSLSYLVYAIKNKLKAEYLSLPPKELKAAMDEKGKSYFMETHRQKLIAYSGDTPVDETFGQWDNTELLIHEATFLSKKDQINHNNRGNKHSSLEEVLQQVAHLNIGKLIVGHFSSRYSAEQIDEAIRHYCKDFRVRMPVYRVLPNQIHRNILAEQPINK
jgi:ribonuclease Z